MKAIYELYVDVLFFRFFLGNFILITFVYLELKKKISVARKLLAAAVMALGTTGFILYGHKQIWLAAIIFFGNSFIGGMILLPNIKIKSMIRFMICTVYYNLLYSCFYEVMKYTKKGHNMLGDLIFASAGIVIILLLRWSRSEKEEYLYDVTIYAFGIKVKLKALLDTGNALRDRKSGKMVCIVEKEKILPILAQVRKEDYYEVAFHSVGSECGMLKAIETDQMCITKETENKIIYGVLLGVYEGKLSSSETFHMILHKDCLKGRKQNGCNMEHLFTKTYQNRSA